MKVCKCTLSALSCSCFSAKLGRVVFDTGIRVGLRDKGRGCIFSGNLIYLVQNTI